VGKIAEAFEEKHYFHEKYDDRGICSCTYSGFYSRIYTTGAKGRARVGCKNCHGEGISPMAVCELDGNISDSEEWI